MVELFDVFDETGKLTGITKTKAEILDAGDWRKVIHIWMVDDGGNLLIQQRSNKRGILDNLWDVTVGGGVSSGEQSRHAAKRELQEELGLDLPEMDFQLLGTWKLPPKPLDEHRNMKDFSDTYLVRLSKIDLKTLKLAPREVQRVDVISLKELSERIQYDDFYNNWAPHGRVYYQEVIIKIISRKEFSKK